MVSITLFFHFFFKGSVFNYIHQKMQKPTSKVAQWYKVLFLTYMAYKHFQAKYPDSNQKKK